MDDSSLQHPVRARESNELHIPSHPIHALPPELIAAILLRYVAAETNTYERNIVGFRSEKTRYPRQYSWLKIRHVCRRWRAIALDTPSLNDKIVISRQDCVEDTLRNSGTIPLHVISGDQVEDTEDTLSAYSLVFSQFHRVSCAVLSLTNRLVELLRQSDVIEGITAPSLQTLRVTFLSINYRDFRLAPPMMDNITFPALREFEIHGGELGFCRSMFSSSLCHLSLRFLDYCVPPDTLLARLEGLQNLESLTLQQCLWEDDRSRFLDKNTWKPQRLTTFPRLRHLVVSETQPGCTFQLFGHISYPADTTVAIGHVFTSHDISPDMITQCLIDKLCGNQLLGEMPIATRVTVDDTCGRPIRIRLWPTTEACDGSEAGSSSQLRPLLEIRSRRKTEITYMLEILGKLSVSHVVDLRVSRVLLDAPSWMRLLTALPSLQSVWVEVDGPVESFSEGLAQAELPHLSCLQYDLSWSVDPVVSLDDLARTLLQRKENGRLIEDLVLVLSRCGLHNYGSVRNLPPLHGLARSVCFKAAPSANSS